MILLLTFKQGNDIIQLNKFSCIKVIYYIKSDVAFKFVC